MSRMLRPVKRHLTAAVLTAVLLIPAALAAEPTRAERQTGGGFFAQAWTSLVSLWSEVGASLDPFGGSDRDAGPGLDPSGLETDAGSGLDPNGRS